MHLLQPIRIQTFVSQALQERAALAIIEDWNIAPEQVIQALIEHFERMGIYQVHPLAEAELMINALYFQLRYNADLYEIRERAKIARLEASARRRG